MRLVRRSLDDEAPLYCSAAQTYRPVARIITIMLHI